MAFETKTVESKMVAGTNFQHTGPLRLIAGLKRPAVDNRLPVTVRSGLWRFVTKKVLLAIPACRIDAALDAV